MVVDPVKAFDDIKAQLQKKLTDQRPADPNHVGPNPPVNLNTQTTNLNALIDADALLPVAERQKPLETLTQDAREQYPLLSDFLQKMSPYGLDIVMMPNLGNAAMVDLEDLADLETTFGIEVAGWLQQSTHDNPAISSDDMMSPMEREKSYHWDFKFPDPLNEAVTATVGTHGPLPVPQLQITKAIRIPFIYRHAKPAVDGQLLLGHIVVGFEGAGNT